ncbi:MAG: hypothetical protein EOO27_27590 [Comamonadaceae bacterium]|nr:MAG: hypothetical protein EOO27_27590 [Comamonadaceae bacterium]
MPYINVKLFEARLDADTESRLLSALTDAVVSVYGEAIRKATWVTIEGVPHSRWGFGGRVAPTPPTG